MRTDIQYPVGTPLYKVPNRYWEKDREIETIYVSKLINPDGSIWPSFRGKHIYVYCPARLLTFYAQASSCFLTKPEAEYMRKHLMRRWELDERKKLEKL